MIYVKENFYSLYHKHEYDKIRNTAKSRILNCDCESMELIDVEGEVSNQFP